MSGGRAPYSDDPDTRLMMEFAAGDDTAFDQLVENFKRQVYGTIYRYIGDAHRAEDCAQEAFLRIYRMRKTYKPTARISTLVYRITTNLCLNLIRDEGRRRMISLDQAHGEAEMPLRSLLRDESAEEVSAPLEAAERRGIVRAALDRIPPRQRIAIVLHRFEGLSYAEIALAMQTNVAAVKSLLSRARISLAEALKADLEAGNL